MDKLDKYLCQWIGARLSFRVPRDEAAVLRARHHGGNLMVGVMRRAGVFRPIGFVLMFPPTDELDYWELSYAVTDRSQRNAFFAIHASDAMLHYMFDHLKVEAVGWRTREDNLAARAVLRRLGYATTGVRELGGYRYLFSRLDRDGWAARRDKLGEDAFVAFRESPFQPSVAEHGV